MGHLGFLKNNIELTAIEILEQAVVLLAPIKDRYRTIVKNLSQQNPNLLLCTVYEGNLVGDSFYSDIAFASKAMVSMFNDIVFNTASTFKIDVLELRNIFISPEDYANPIEPSHLGGKKYSQEILRWVNDK